VVASSFHVYAQLDRYYDAMSDDENDEELDRGVEGYSIEIPKFHDLKISKYYDYSDLSADFHDLHELNKRINAVTVALFKITDTINKAERTAKAAKLKYERKYRRKYLEAQEKTEAAKRVWAEIMVEDLENKYMYYEQLTMELNRASYTLRQELKSLEAIGNNYRQQIKTV